MSPHPSSLSFFVRATCCGSPAQVRPRHRILVVIIVITAVAIMVTAGYEVASAVGAVLAVGIAAAEIATRLLGPVAASAVPAV
jgi:hypothetical protein